MRRLLVCRVYSFSKLHTIFLEAVSKPVLALLNPFPGVSSVFL